MVPEVGMKSRYSEFRFYGTLLIVKRHQQIFIERFIGKSVQILSKTPVMDLVSEILQKYQAQ